MTMNPMYRTRKRARRKRTKSDNDRLGKSKRLTVVKIPKIQSKNKIFPTEIKNQNHGNQWRLNQAQTSSEDDNSLGKRQEEDGEIIVDKIPHTFWHKIKTFAHHQIPIICKIFSRNEKSIETLLTAYLSVSGLTAHKAIAKYCQRKMVEHINERNGVEITPEKPSKLMRILNWINRRLSKWVGPSKNEEILPIIAENNLEADEHSRDLVFYPEKLNLIVFPPTSVKKDLEEEEEETAEDLAEELEDDMEDYEEKWINSIPDEDYRTEEPVPRKTRSCAGRNCPVPETNDDLKNLNDLSMILNGFDKSPMHFVFGNEGNAEVKTDDQLKDLKVPEQNDFMNFKSKFGHEKEIEINKVGHGKQIDVKIEAPSCHKETELEKIENGLVDEVQAVEKTAEKFFKHPIDNTINFGKSVADELLPSDVPEEFERADIPKTDPEVSTALYNAEKVLDKMEESREKFDKHPNDNVVNAVEPNNYMNKQNSHHKAVVIVMPILLILIVIIFIVWWCCCREKKKRKRSDYSFTDEERGSFMDVEMRVEEVSDVEDTSPDSEFPIKRYATLREKGSKKSRKQSYADDRWSAGQLKKKKSRRISRQEDEELRKPRYRDSGSLTNEDSFHEVNR